MLLLSFVITSLLILIFKPELFTFVYWSDPKFNRSDVLRNMLLIPVGAVGLYIAVKRSTIAAGQLRTSETGLDIDRFQKAVELLQEDAISSRVAGVISLHDIAIKSSEYRNTAVQILITFMQSKDSDFEVEKYFQDQSIGADVAYEQWLGRPPVKTDSIKAFEALVDLDFSPVDVNQAFASAYKGIYLHGTYLKELPSCTFTRCDFSACNIRCKEGTLFVGCDLTNATIIFDNPKGYAIFPSSNVSNMRLQVPNEVSPVINGWHWEGFPPKVASDWRFIPSPSKQRVIKFDQKRRFPISMLADFYSSRSLGVPNDDPSFFLDDPDTDYEQQTFEQAPTVKMRQIATPLPTLSRDSFL